MSAPIDALMAELAAAELAVREAVRAALRNESIYGKASFAAFTAREESVKAFQRKNAAEAAMTAYALTWAAERAQSFVTPANDTPDGKLLAALDDAFAPLARMK